MYSTTDSPNSQALRDEIDELERRLEAAKVKLSGRQVAQEALPSPSKVPRSVGQSMIANASRGKPDSALPLGSFAFSSGLESYLAHTRPNSSFPAFLAYSLSSYASATLPFVLAAHRNVAGLVELDDALDAAIMCTVGRRASVAQGRALLSIWDRSFSSALPDGASAAHVQVLKDFAVLLRGTSTNVSCDLPTASAHLGPLFGAIASILGMSLQQTGYVFILSHVKALLSAAVRASIFGPYHAQKLLASVAVQKGIQGAIDQQWETDVENAGQSVPIMDLWVGRHEMLYSRIFNS
ncbi:hypothetical protein QTJ16_001607 [Diplocarpon rosae]|uniref:Urease accessory protein UreF n=1 Tax=Diplocarpon rosae TaxID=946125 RepID=A0AAD9WGR2_9HELO|nr:hypothetical protein QTJ16_001607 [Diplocarpon rosae]